MMVLGGRKGGGEEGKRQAIGLDRPTRAKETRKDGWGKCLTENSSKSKEDDQRRIGQREN